MKKTRCVIFNPSARGEKATRFHKYLAQLGNCQFKPTTGAGAARALAAAAVGEGFETIIAAGGDGTLNEVLNGMGDVPGGFERTRLAVIPLGTTNVFALESEITDAVAFVGIQCNLLYRFSSGRGDTVRSAADGAQD